MQKQSKNWPGVQYPLNVTSPSSLQRSYKSITDHWTASVKNHIPSDGRKIVLCLVGNKADMEPEREVPREEAQLFAAENDAIFAETSAFTGENVLTLFEELGE